MDTEHSIEAGPTAAVEQEARFGSNRSEVGRFLGLDQEGSERCVLMVGNPETVETQEGLTILTDGAWAESAMKGFKEINDPSYVIRIRNKEGMTGRDRLLDISMTADCPPYRVIKAMTERGIHL